MPSQCNIPIFFQFGSICGEKPPASALGILMVFLRTTQNGHFSNRNQERAGPNRPLLAVLRLPLREVIYETVRKWEQEELICQIIEAVPSV